MDEEARHDLEATLSARRELGSAHDEELIEGFLDRLEQRLGERRPKPTKAIDPHASMGMRFALTIVSLLAGIPISAIALTQSGLVALAVCWAGIVLVNVVFAGRRP